MRVVNLRRTDKRNHCRRIKIIGQKLFRNSDIGTMRCFQEWNCAGNRTCFLESSHHLIVRRGVQGDRLSVTHRPHDGNFVVTQVFPMKVFITLLKIGTNRNGTLATPIDQAGEVTPTQPVETNARSNERAEAARIICFFIFLMFFGCRANVFPGSVVYGKITFQGHPARFYPSLSENNYSELADIFDYLE